MLKKKKIGNLTNMFTFSLEQHLHYDNTNNLRLLIKCLKQTILT